jgi:Rps23 Pro-64 3,4-dihydroxylase Tpa1-like proline 4-hydroxylase
MKITYESNQAIVIDNFLKEICLKEIQTQVECLKLKQLEYGDDKIYKLNCGTIYKSDKKYKYDSLAMAPLPIRDFMKTIHATAKEHSFLGAWKNFSCMAHAYASGAELSWHRDAGNFTGAYTFYLHKHWMHTWGGNMLIASPDTKFDVYKDAPEGVEPQDMYAQQFNKILPTFNLAHESKSVLNPGVGIYIAPLPNRIVFVNKSIVHKVERIDASAGSNYRLSLTGFFE